jgi:hypothetical protein
MQSDRQHHMNITQTYSTGAEEWYCPICGRMFILQMSPEYKKIVLEEGDTSVFHTGSITDPLQVEKEPENEEHLNAWKQFLKDINFDSLWEEDDRSNMA